jgi:DNA-binding response OmpR family regulator
MPDYTILIVDYEPRSITKLTSLFQEVGYHVEVARDGLSAIDKFLLLKPDLVVMEAMIPRKHGFDACEAIKKTPNGKVTPVLILTGVYKGRKYRWQARYQHGCDEFIEKPVSDEFLLDAVNRLLRRSGPRTAGAAERIRDPAPEITPDA